MKIMVFDVPAEKGGALSILNEFYNRYKEDRDNEYIFVVSKPKIEETENIKVLRYPWIKKSWFHRLYFDNFIAPKIISEYGVDKVLSLQNIIIPHTKVYQTVYVHNALPFSEHKFSILEDRLLWTYQNVLSRGIYKSIRKANKVIVQTEWMSRACVEKLNVNKDKIEVLQPEINIVVETKFQPNKENLSTFFYPASSALFKNHKVIVDACIELKKMGFNNYKVIFTLDGDENENISNLYKEIKNNDLPITFIGNISRKEVFNYYSKSVLIFPSYIETVGLPLIEAKMHDTPIIASNTEFSHEILDGYKNVVLFDPFDYKELSKEISKKIEMF